MFFLEDKFKNQQAQEDIKIAEDIQRKENKRLKYYQPPPRTKEKIEERKRKAEADKPFKD